MIPQQKLAAVTRGLQEAFGTTEFEDIRALNKGLTGALVFRIVVRGAPFLLRVIMRTDSTTARHFTCMKQAADAGLSPQVRYTSLEDQIAITDFVQAVPFSAPEALKRMPGVLRAVHALPPFPTAANHLNTTCMFLLHKGPALDGLIQSFQAKNTLSKEETDELFARYAQVAAVYPHDDSDKASSHNDLFKPDNILFDGDRVLLVDWEAAFLNDRYADLAVVANLLVNNDAEELAYLQAYFGQPPDQYQRARFFLAQQVSHLFYALVFLLLGSSGKPLDESGSGPAFRDFSRQFWAGEVKLEDSQTKTVYGRTHLEQLLRNTSQTRLREALSIVADRPAHT